MSGWGVGKGTKRQVQISNQEIEAESVGSLSHEQQFSPGGKTPVEKHLNNQRLRLHVLRSKEDENFSKVSRFFHLPRTSIKDA